MGKNVNSNNGFKKPMSHKKGNTRHFSLKNHVGATIAVASILVAGGALGAGHFAYKIGHEHGQVEETTIDRIKTDPSISDYVDPITPTILPTGDAECVVKIKKDTSLLASKINDEKLIGKVITGVNVSIGSKLLIKGDDYTVSELLPVGKCKSATVTIKSGTMKKYSTGSIYVAPVLAEESFVVNFNNPNNPSDLSKGWSLATSQQVYNKRYAAEPAVSISGYELVGWYKDPGYANLFSFGDAITSDLELYSRWKEVAGYLTVTFNINYGEEPSTTKVSVMKGEKLTQPLDPSRPGYLFGGWFKNKECTQQWDFSEDKVDKAYTLYAKWNDNFLTYEYDSTAESSSVKVTDSAYCPQIVEIKAKDNDGHDVTTIKEEGFKGCSSASDKTYQINSVTIPSSINTIGLNAFENCSTLKAANFGDTESNWTISSSDGSVIVQNWIPSKSASENAVALNKTYVNCVFTKNSNTMTIESTHNIDINNKTGYVITCKDSKTKEDLNDVIFSSSNEKVAKIDETTKNIVPVEKGSAKISAYQKGYTINSFDIEVGSFDNIDYTDTAAISVKRDGEGKPLELTKLIIPTRVYDDGANEFKNITGIAENGFKGCELTTSTEVSVPSFITSIGNSAFADTNITQITFEGTSTLTMLNEGVFARSKLTSIKIPSSIITINPGAFLSCTNLSTVTFEGTTDNPCKVNLIDDQAFKGCTQLTEITVPKSVTYIGTDAFGDCGITKITVEDGNKKYTSKNTSSEETNCIVEKSTSQLVFMAKNVTVIPDTVNGIQSKAFYKNKTLTTMSIPSSVKEIGSSAFEGSSLTGVTIADGVETIGDSAFKDCTKLTKIKIPGSVKSIGANAFNGCAYLEEIIFVDNATSTLTIGDSAFEGCCAALKEKAKTIQISLPTQTISVGKSAFASCAIINKVTLNENLTTLGSNAFSNNKITAINITKNLVDLGDSVYSGNEITSITVDSENTKYESPDDSNVLILRSNGELVMGCKGSDLTKTNNVLVIGAYAFDNCQGLSKVEIPDSVIFINEGAFRSCNDLTEVIIGSGVKTISDGAFSLCSSLQTVIVKSPTIASSDNPGYLYQKLDAVKKTIYLPDTITTVGAYITENYMESVPSILQGYKQYIEKEEIEIELKYDSLKSQLEELGITLGEDSSSTTSVSKSGAFKIKYNNSSVSAAAQSVTLNFKNSASTVVQTASVTFETTESEEYKELSLTFSAWAQVGNKTISIEIPQS